MVTAGIYARISLDRKDGEGVERQLADCRQLAAGRGWDVVEYVDNDISAYRAKRRPEWERLLHDLEHGALQILLAYHSDRLYRRLTELERLSDLIGKTGAEVVTVKAGDVDFATATGRMVAGILGSIAKGESERIGERVTRAKQERAAHGRPSGGGRRPFGLNPTRTELVVEEAVEARRIAAALRDGTSTWRAEVRRLNEAGFTTTSGGTWTAASLRRALTSPYIAGLRSYHGVIVGPASWPAVVDRETWDELRATAASRKWGRPRADRHLLTGLLICGRCESPLYANEVKARNVRAYTCRPNEGSCGRLSISAPVLEGHVESTVLGWLAHPVVRSVARAYLEHGADGDAEALTQRDEIERRLVRLSERWAAGEIGDAEYDGARAVLARRSSEVEARILSDPRPGFLLPEGDLAEAYETLTTPERREVLGRLLVVPINVQPAEGLPTADRVELSPAWG